jgi:hypothetical protein
MTDTLNKADIKLIKSKIDRAYFSLARVYGPFLIALILAYQYAKDKKGMKNITPSQYVTIYLIVFGFFFIVFAVFCIRDYRKQVLPYKKELTAPSKIVSTFLARKYFDPIYRQYLLYHPTRENKYILLTEDEFNSIADGAEIELQTGKNTGIVLAISINGKLLDDVEEFSFS